jgi:hypothetical protein
MSFMDWRHDRSVCTGYTVRSFPEGFSRARCGLPRRGEEGLGRVWSVSGQFGSGEVCFGPVKAGCGKFRQGVRR